MIGIWRGLKTLESVESYAVSLNLGMIVALLVALLWQNVSALLGGMWALPEVSSAINFADLRVVLGLLIVVQGFETSRYLGADHPPEQRIATMRVAQRLSSGIYLAFICLALMLYRDGLGADVTAIIQMVQPVAFLLPILITIAAVGSQFSAAVADNAGAGGLLSDITNNRISQQIGYGIILLVTLLLTWMTHVNEIIAYASRAFALFYFLQCLVAWFVARQQASGGWFAKHRYLIPAALSLLVFILGIPAE